MIDDSGSLGMINYGAATVVDPTGLLRDWSSALIAPHEGARLRARQVGWGHFRSKLANLAAEDMWKLRKNLARLVN